MWRRRRPNRQTDIDAAGERPGPSLGTIGLTAIVIILLSMIF